MDFALNEEQLELQEMVREFVEKEITKESGRHRNDGNNDNRLFTRGTNYPCGWP